MKDFAANLAGRENRLATPTWRGTSYHSDMLSNLKPMDAVRREALVQISVIQPPGPAALVIAACNWR